MQWPQRLFVAATASEDIRVVFGRRLKELRTVRGMSQEALAFESGLHRTYVSSAERGARNVSLINIEKLARALDIPIRDLFSSV